MLSLIIATASICCKTVEVVKGPQASADGGDPHQLSGIYGKFSMNHSEGNVRYVSENESMTIVLGERLLPGIGSLTWRIQTFQHG